jgi:hypothetical protein
MITLEDDLSEIAENIDICISFVMKRHFNST